MATPKTIRAIVIIIGTAIAGRAVKKGDVLLVPEDVTDDTARSLMRMTRPRAKEADEAQAKKRLAEYSKAQEERKAREKAKREADAAAAQAELDELAKLQQEIVSEAEGKAADILKAAEEKARKIVDDANAKAADIIKAAEDKAKGNK